jgi:hypothetical protein
MVVMNRHELFKERCTMTRSARKSTRITGGPHDPAEAKGLHPAWFAFIRHCREMGFGEISQLKIQDGIPVMAEESTKKVKFI